MPTVRQTLLQAARDVVVAGNWGRTSMAQVAAAAGVSRQTLYNEFGDKDGLAMALAAAETEWFLAGIQAELDAHPDVPLSGLHAAVSFALNAASDDPLVKAVLAGARGAEELLPFLTTRAEPLLRASSVQLSRYLTAHWPELPYAHIALVADSLIRLTVSHVVLPLAAADVVADQLTALAERLLLTVPTPQAPISKEVTA